MLILSKNIELVFKMCFFAEIRDLSALLFRYTKRYRQALSMLIHTPAVIAYMLLGFCSASICRKCAWALLAIDIDLFIYMNDIINLLKIFEKKNKQTNIENSKQHTNGCGSMDKEF